MSSTSKWAGLCRYVGWACILIILVLSLLPARDMYRTGAPKGVEHFAAYWGTGLMLGIAFCDQLRRRGLAIAMLIALAAAMEFLQAVSPGRTPHVSDFLASSAGAVIGVLMAGAVIRLIAARQPDGI